MPFVFPADVTGMTDASIGAIHVWTLLNYRISVITDEGEYIGEMGTVHFDEGGDGGLDADDLWLMIAAAVIASVSFTAILWLIIRNKR